MKDCCSTPGLMRLEEAQQVLLETVKPILATEKLPLTEASQRILAKPVVSSVNVPPHANSAMDGYAVNSEDLQQHSTLKLAGTALAGSPFSGTVAKGHCIRIMTGAWLPSGCDAVVMQENTEAKGDLIHFNESPKAGRNVRLQGEDIASGSTLMTAGQLLGAAELGMLASVGVGQVEVFKRPVVAILSTGDELKAPGETLGPGQIYDSNRFALHGALSQLPVQVLDFGLIPDNPEAIRSTLLEADQQADLIITSGGVSVGCADYTREVLQEIGQTGFWKLAIKPGKPLAFGQLPQSYYLGLPGNPAAAMVTFDLFVRLVIKRLQGLPWKSPFTVTATAQTTLKKGTGRREFQRGKLSQDSSHQLMVCSSGRQSSGVLSSMSSANCYIVLPEESSGVETGEAVEVLPFSSLRYE